MTQSLLRIEVSVGELIDKLTILEIKRARIADAAKLANVTRKWDSLDAARRAAGLDRADLAALTARLKSVNETLWDIEDDIRDCERRGDFGPDFIRLARAVYRTNDERAALKRRIDLMLGSRLMEEKNYSPYRPDAGQSPASGSHDDRHCTQPGERPVRALPPTCDPKAF